VSNIYKMITIFWQYQASVQIYNVDNIYTIKLQQMFKLQKSVFNFTAFTNYKQ